MLVVALPAQAQENLSQSAAINALLMHSKVGEQLGSIADRFEQNVSQLNLQLTSDQQQMLIKQGVAAFDSTRLVRYAKDYFAEHYREDLASEAVRQLRLRSEGRIDSVMQANIDPGALRRYAGGLHTNPPPQERVQLMRRMSRAQRAPQFYFNNTMDLRHAVVEAAGAISNASSPTQALPDSSALRRTTRNMALISFLYMYRDVPLDPLEEYVSFYESEAGQWYVDTYSAAIRRALAQASAALNDEIKTLR
jgi:hypothetical protein